jgi:hypothetical protein
VDELEKFLTDLITQTPIIVSFTAADAAAYIGIKVALMSSWLQRYRDVEGNKTLSTAKFTIVCWNRGPGAEWFITTWPGMSPAGREMSGEISTNYAVMTVVREEIRPMLRNIEVEFTPTVLRNRRVNRALVSVNRTKLDGYRTIVLNLQRDSLVLSKAKMKRAAMRLNKVMDATIDEIDTWRSYLATL